MFRVKRRTEGGCEALQQLSSRAQEWAQKFHFFSLSGCQYEFNVGEYRKWTKPLCSLLFVAPCSRSRITDENKACFVQTSWWSLSYVCVCRTFIMLMCWYKDSNIAMKYSESVGTDDLHFAANFVEEFLSAGDYILTLCGDILSLHLIV